MKKAIALLLMMVLVLCVSIAAVEASKDFLGKPFPDFTVTDSEGKTFTLSEALKDHEAVLINFWATWCDPCKNEFPMLNKVYEEVKDKVAFIALSKEPKDTAEKIEAFRRERGLTFPMGRDEDQKLLNCVDTSGGVPRTVIVDRFGNAVFYHDRTFRSVADIRAVLNTFTGDGYTESKVLDAIPQDTSTQLFPVSKAQAIYPEESSKYKKFLVYADILPNPWPGYIVTDDPVRLRIEISAKDNPATIQYLDDVNQGAPTVESLLDPESGAYVYSQNMPTAETREQWLQARLYDNTKSAGPAEYAYCILVRDEKGIDGFVQYLNGAGDLHARWEYAEETTELSADGQKAYVIHVVDQDGNPVEEVTVNFCTDTACTPEETDEAGMIAFEGEPREYHVQIVDVPEGYSYDESFDMYTTAEYGEWVLRVKKD